MSESIAELRADLAALHQRAHHYFMDAMTASKQKVEGLYAGEAYKIQGRYWEHLEIDEKERAEAIIRDLVEVMSKIAVASRRSPLLHDADQHEVVIHAKSMRSAMYFRRYVYLPPEAIHDDGTVLGVSHAQQMEEAVGIDTARKIFNTEYREILRILDLTTVGLDYSSVPLSADQVNKYRSNTAFVMMWMDRDHPELDDVRDVIKHTFESFGITALRGDDIEHDDVITKRILDEIATSEFLIADLTGERPSVYYEVGFAHALGKRVILYRKQGTTLHFDLAVHNCPEYENLGDLRNKLSKRLSALTNRSPAK